MSPSLGPLLGKAVHDSLWLVKLTLFLITPHISLVNSKSKFQGNLEKNPLNVSYKIFFLFFV